MIHDDGSIGFTLGDYDSSRELVIDPILDYTTFIGGTGFELSGIAADNAGNVYIIGPRLDRFPDYDRCSDRHTAAEVNDIYVAKLSSDGSSLVFSTFIGGAA